jgi:hypothetical protein
MARVEQGARLQEPCSQQALAAAEIENARVVGDQTPFQETEKSGVAFELSSREYQAKCPAER